METMKIIHPGEILNEELFNCKYSCIVSQPNPKTIQPFNLSIIYPDFSKQSLSHINQRHPIGEPGNSGIRFQQFEYE